ncbi:hypothetical protein [Pseudomonas farsensis]|uniref:DUF2169 domain-containing protein n=1 Tax=Pseudomonas farsensis TaxID=2745492 RepID=A0ABU8QPG4_9PSED
MSDEDAQFPTSPALKASSPWLATLRFNGGNVDKYCALQWAGNHTGSGELEHVHFDRIVEVGRSWENSHIVLSRPLASYNSPYCSPGKLEIRRLVLQDLNIRLGMDPGDRIRGIREIRVVDRTANRYLFQEFPLDAFIGTYHRDGSVALKISKGSRFYMAYLGLGPIEADEPAAMGYRQHFEALPDAQRVVMLRQVKRSESGPPWPTPSHFYVRKASDRSDWYWFYLNHDDMPDGLLPYNRSAELPANVTDTRPTFYFMPSPDGRLAPSGQDDSFDEMIQWLYPEGVLLFQYSRRPSADTGYELEMVYEYAYARRDPVPIAQEAPATLRQYADPLVKLVSGVRNRTLLSALPHTGHAPAWTFKGKAHGALELTGNDCWYCPPADPGVPHDNTGKTLRPCIYKAPEFSPVVIDKVISGTAENPLQSTYVVLNAQPTHYFRVEERGHQVGLQLCYQAHSGGEVVVAPEDIEWHVLDGEGVMDAAGAFTPGRDQPFSVVLAIEKDDRRLYWAVIILPLPLKSVREFVTMSNKVS